MDKKFRSIASRFFCGIFVASCIGSVPSYCSAATADRVNSLLKSICEENPSLKSKEDNIKSEIYKRFKVARERNYSEGVSTQYELIKNSLDKKETFQKIYESNFWGNDESKSGPGSRMNSTDSVRENLPKLFEKYNIKSVLDAPCGDYNWMKAVDKSDIKYIGGDIVPKIIDENNKKFKDDNTSFEVIDITSDEIPKVDLIICRDCLQHLSQNHVKKALRNFKKSGSKYLLVTNYPWTLENYDIKDGDFNPLNLSQKPFNLSPNCVEKIKESDEIGNCVDKYLYLYKLEDIDVDKMFTEKKQNSNIPVAMAFDEGYVYPTVVSITSAMENSNAGTNYDFYLMHTPDLSKESKRILKSLEKKYPRCKIHLIDMKNKFESAHTDSRIPTAGHYRLMLSDLLPNEDKVIWVDGDTLILKDLTEMMNIDMDGYCYKGFLDYPSHIIYTKKVFGIDAYNYICSGVMLLNLKELRNQNAVQKFEKFIAENNDKLATHDQSVINAVFVDKIGALPAKYGIFNTFFHHEKEVGKWTKTLSSPENYTVKEITNACHNPVILHCVSKPWLYPNASPASKEWWKYAKKTDIFNKIKDKYLIADGTYKIVSALDTDKVLDIAKSGKKSCTKLRLWDDNGTDAQKFRVKYDKDRCYTIEAVCSQKLIEVPTDSTKEGTQLWQYTKNNSDGQKWYIIANKDGSRRIISKYNGMCMDIKNSEATKGTPIQCYRPNFTNAQKFKFVKVK